MAAFDPFAWAVEFICKLSAMVSTTESNSSEMPLEAEGLRNQNVPLLTASPDGLSIADPAACPTLRLH